MTLSPAQFENCRRGAVEQRRRPAVNPTRLPNLALPAKDFAEVEYNRAQPGQTLPDRHAIMESLDRVLDPELDESIVKLGFVRSLRLAPGAIEITLELPTYWCAANFAYLMAQDVRRELLAVAGVDAVAVRLPNHFASQAIEAAINGGLAFAEAFPNEGLGELESLRLLFGKKAFIRRQARLLRELSGAGLTAHEICQLALGDLAFPAKHCEVRLGEARAYRFDDAEVVRRYLERRRRLGISCAPSARLVTDVDGQPIAPQTLAAYLACARTVQVSFEANGAMCRALLEAKRLSPGAGGISVRFHPNSRGNHVQRKRS